MADVEQLVPLAHVVVALSWPEEAVERVMQAAERHGHAVWPDWADRPSVTLPAAKDIFRRLRGTTLPDPHVSAAAVNTGEYTLPPV